MPMSQMVPVMASGAETPGQLRRRVLQLAMPSVGEQVLNLLVGIVSTILVGHLGAAALAAVGLATTITMIASTFFFALATGSTALIAQAIGAQRPRDANSVLEQSVLVGLGLGIASAALLLPFTRQTMVIMGAEPDAVGMGQIYLAWTSYVLPLNALLFVGNGALRGAGDTRTPMFVMAAVNVINIVIALGLISGPGPLPALGVTGAAIAAAASTVAGTLMVFAVLMRGRAGLKLKVLLPYPNVPVLKQLLDIGLPAAGENLLMRLSFLAYTRAISSLGTVAYAAYLIAQRVESLNTMPASGFATAAMTLAGQSLGAREPERARRAIFRSVEISLAISLVWACFSFFLPRTMLSIFTNDPQVIAEGALPVRMVAFAQPMMSVAFGLSGGLRGIGDTRAVMWITGVGSWLVRVPLAILAVTTLGLGLPGVQLSMVLDWGVRMVLSGWRFRPGCWRRLTAQRLERMQFAPASE